MRLNEFDTESIIDNLRTFQYTTVIGDETVTKTVNLFSHAQAPLANKLFLQAKGRLKADDIMISYKAGDISASDLSAMVLTVIKSQLVQLWKIWEADYNPLWNVDGVEKRVIKTEFGKVVAHDKDSSVTDEQVTDGKNNVTHGMTLTDEQKTDGKNNVTHGRTLTDEQLTDGKNNITHGKTLTDEQKTDGKNNVTHGKTLTDQQTVDGKNNTTHGKVLTITEPTQTHKVSAFDSVAYEPDTEDSATTHSDTESGSTNIALSMGTVSHAETGTTNTALSMGKIEHSEDGTTNTAISMGKIEHVEGGTTNTALSMGKIEHVEGGTTNTALSMGKIKHDYDGTDTDTESGDETTTDTYTRSGNIGVTMSTQLLRDGENFWSQYSFFEHYFSLIAEQLTIPIYED